MAGQLDGLRADKLRKVSSMVEGDGLRQSQLFEKKEENGDF